MHWKRFPELGYRLCIREYVVKLVLKLVLEAG